MNTFNNKYDPIDELIFSENLRILSFDVDPFHDALLVIMNNNTALPLPLSDYPALKHATASQLTNFRIVSKGTGIHWPELDEDLSLRGFIKSLLRNIVRSHSDPMTLAKLLYKSS